MPRKFPNSAATWAAAYPTIPTPSGIWTFQESASPILDKVGTADLVQNQGLLYAQTGDPEPFGAARLSLEFDTTAAAEWTGPASNSYGTISGTSSYTMYIRFRMPDNVSSARWLWGKGLSTGPRFGAFLQPTTGTMRFIASSDGITTFIPTTTIALDDGNYHDVLFVVDRSPGVAAVRIYTEAETASFPIGALGGVSNTQTLHFGGSNAGTALSGTRISYAALWPSIALTAADLVKIRTSVEPVALVGLTSSALTAQVNRRVIASVVSATTTALSSSVSTGAVVISATPADAVAEALDFSLAYVDVVASVLDPELLAVAALSPGAANTVSSTFQPSMSTSVSVAPNPADVISGVDVSLSSEIDLVLSDVAEAALEADDPTIRYVLSVGVVGLASVGLSPVVVSAITLQAGVAGVPVIVGLPLAPTIRPTNTFPGDLVTLFTGAFDPGTLSIVILAPKRIVMTDGILAEREKPDIFRVGQV